MKILGAPLKTFFFCLFLFVKSPLWPQGTSARLIPGLPGVEGKEGGRGQRFKNKKIRWRENNQVRRRRRKKRGIVGGSGDEWSAFTCGLYHRDLITTLRELRAASPGSYKKTGSNAQQVPEVR